MNNSNRSTKSGLSRFFFANGDISTGKSMMNVGWISLGSTYSLKISPTSIPRVGCGSTSSPRSSTCRRSTSTVGAS